MKTGLAFKVWFSASLAFILSVSIIIGAALAGETTMTGSVDGIGVTARKSILQNSDRWTTYVYSYTNNGTAIGTIGYTYWTVREYCVPTQTITFQWQDTGRVNYGSSGYFNAATVLYRNCSGQRQLISLGNHDFKQGSSVWQPYLNHSEYR